MKLIKSKIQIVNPIVIQIQIIKTKVIIIHLQKKGLLRY